MARPGPPPKPTALKLIAGNPGKKRLPQGEPKPMVEAPVPPKHLTAEARVEWERLAPILVRLKLLTKLDRAALAAYCQAWARHVEAEEQVAKASALAFTHNGYPIVNPWIDDLEAGGRSDGPVHHRVRHDACSAHAHLCARSGTDDQRRRRQNLPRSRRRYQRRLLVRRGGRRSRGAILRALPDPRQRRARRPAAEARPVGGRAHHPAAIRLETQGRHATVSQALRRASTQARQVDAVAPALRSTCCTPTGSRAPRCTRPRPIGSRRRSCSTWRSRWSCSPSSCVAAPSSIAAPWCISNRRRATRCSPPTRLPSMA